MPDAQTLAQAVKTKYPGVYDDIPDAELETKVKEKYPGVYDDFPTTKTTPAAMAPAAPQSEIDRLKQVIMPPPEQATQAVRSVTRGVINTLNPIPMVKEIANRGLIGTAQDILAAQGRVGKQAVEDVQQGRYVDALRHGLAYLVPILGPAVSASGDKLEQGLQQGDKAKVGEAIGEHLGFVAPVVIAESHAAVRSPSISRLTPEQQAAVDFGRQHGVPIDAATATGNQFVRNVQAGTAATPLGSMVVESAQRGQQAALASTAGQLASQASPSAVTAEQAGQGATDAVSQAITDFNSRANTAYDSLRAIEEVNKMNPAASVDLRPVKAALTPVYERLLRQMPVAQQQASHGLLAIKNIMESPNMMSVSDADEALGAIKSFARADNPAVRTVSQGLAAKAVSELSDAVTEGATAMGPQAIKALQEGRAATIQKYAANDVLSTLSDEPVKAYRQAVAPQDAGIAGLRELTKYAPDAPKQVGRAWLDTVFGKAQEQGGFARTDAIYADWQRLGPATKQMLYGSALTEDLNNFFLLAKKLGEQPNPSGTARTLISMGTGGLLLTEPVTGVAVSLGQGALAKLLYSPRVVKALTAGMRVPVANKAAAVAAMSELLKAASETGASVPAFAQSQGPDPR